MSGTLYLVATPIGNLKDISFRAIDVLKSVDIIACEDTRHTRKLLNAYDIRGQLVSYHAHNETDRVPRFIESLRAGHSIAVVSDAGTPGINDPGFVIVAECIKAAIRVVPIPGAIAFANAAIVSGLPTEQIFFGGFLPSKKGDRRRYLESVRLVPATLVFYESPQRLGKALADCLDVLDNRNAAVVRELTKLYEEVVRGDLQTLAGKYLAEETKGEIVIVIEQNTGEELPRGETDLVARVRFLEENGMERKAALKTAAKEFGLGKSEAYRVIQSSKNID